MSDENGPRQRGAPSGELVDQATPGLDGRGRPRRFPIELIDEIELDDGPEWLIQGVLPADGLGVIYGTPGTGKSFVALDVALHVADGRAWMGRKVRQAGVVYVAAEAGRGMRKRIVAALRHHHFPRSLPLALITVAPKLGHREGDARLLADDIVAQLPDGFRPGLIVIDTLARAMAGCDESGTAGMSVFIENAETLGRELGAIVWAVHHSGKDLDRGMRGSSALLGAADAVWRIVPDEDNPLETSIRIEKMKEEEDKLDLPFALERVDLEPHRDGEPRSSCAVIPRLVLAAKPKTASEAPPASSASLGRERSSGRTAFLRALSTLLERHGTTTKRFKHVPADTKVLRQADLADNPELGISGGSAKSRQSQIDRHVRELEDEGIVHRHGGYLWLARDPALTLSEEKQAA